MRKMTLDDIQLALDRKGIPMTRKKIKNALNVRGEKPDENGKYLSFQIVRTFRDDGSIKRSGDLDWR